jgi:hypothetical protein
MASGIDRFLAFLRCAEGGLNRGALDIADYWTAFGVRIREQSAMRSGAAEERLMAGAPARVVRGARRGGGARASGACGKETRKVMLGHNTYAACETLASLTHNALGNEAKVLARPAALERAIPNSGPGSCARRSSFINNLTRPQLQWLLDDA